MNLYLTEAPQSLACDLTAIPTPERKDHILTVQQVFQAVEHVLDLPNGFAFRLPNEPGMFMALAHFVENERLCCPFYHFGLEIEPNGGPLWLRLTGGDGVKQLLETVAGDLPEAVRQQLIHTGPDDQLNEVIAQAAPMVATAFQQISPA